MRLETQILSHLIHNENYSRKVLPFLKDEYFNDFTEKTLYRYIKKHVEEYNTLPTVEILGITLDNDEVDENDFEPCIKYLSQLTEREIDEQWLTDRTEEFCQERAIHNAIMKSIHIMDGKEKETKGAIPEILSEALSISFDNHIGHDYLQDYEQRYEVYHRKEEKIPFDLEYFNKITKGGLPNKTLNIALAGTGVGKSLFMCHVASSVLLQGKNVLYITAEMAEERIAERIDANLLNVNIQEITDLPKVMFDNKVNKLASKTQGTLIIKEYPTATAHAGHFKALLNELALKKSFRPDIIFIDYLNICASSRYSKLGNVNSYTHIKAIAEELRGLAVEFSVPIVSATQTTRSGYGSSDVELTDTSESFGLPATADLMFALISTEELEELGQIMVKQLKNRYNDPTINKRFIVGIDRAKMRLYDCEQSAQKDILDNGQDADYDEPENKFKNKFAELKF